jgi:hypothetical protein
VCHALDALLVLRTEQPATPLPRSLARGIRVLRRPGPPSAWGRGLEAADAPTVAACAMRCLRHLATAEPLGCAQKVAQAALHCC